VALQHLKRCNEAQQIDEHDAWRARLRGGRFADYM
jgi:hypothetical protein